MAHHVKNHRRISQKFAATIRAAVYIYIGCITNTAQDKYSTFHNNTFLHNLHFSLFILQDYISQKLICACLNNAKSHSDMSDLFLNIHYHWA
jgi:hypothetical protein